MDRRSQRRSRRRRPLRSRARGAGARRHSGRRSRRTRRRLLARVTPLALLLLAALVLAASLAPAGQAHAARERSPEEEAASAAGKAAKQAERTEREERAAAEKAQRASEKAAARSERAAARAEDETQSGGRRKQNSSRERPHGDVHFSCTEVTWRFKDFNEGSNTIIGVLRIFSQDPPRRIPETFTFDGPGDEFTVPIPITDQFAGTYKVDSWAKWKGNGVKGSWDILGKLTCAPKPAFSIEKLQKIAGGSGSYTSSTITGQVGDTVDYQIVVKNTGNVPLTLGSFTDPHCDSGTVSGGPGDNALAVGESTTYTCTHPLDEAGSYTNTATVTGTPPDGDGSPVNEHLQHGARGSVSGATDRAAGVLDRKASEDRRRLGLLHVLDDHGPGRPDRRIRDPREEHRQRSADPRQLHRPPLRLGNALRRARRHGAARGRVERPTGARIC